MRKCFLHIGTHRTATTSIQRLLDGHPQELELDGFLYPLVGRPEDAPAGHHNLAWQISGDRRFRPDFGTQEALLREIANTSRNIILSSEDFTCSAYSREQFESFIAAIEQLGIRVNVIFFLRNQIEYAESLYAILLLFGFTRPFSAFCDEILTAGEVRWRKWIFPFRYDKFLGDLESRASVEIMARSYDRPAAGSVVLEFLAAVGLPPRRYIGSELPHDNRRPDLGDCIRRYWRNRAGYSLDDRDLESLLGPSRLSKPDWPTMSPALRARFAATFAAPNYDLCKKFRVPAFELTRRANAASGPPLDEVFTSHMPMKAAIDNESNKPQ